MASSSDSTSGLLSAPSHSTSMTTAQLSVVEEDGLYLSFDEAMLKLPKALKPQNEDEHEELAMFYSMLDEIHKPAGGKDSIGLTAKSIHVYVDTLYNSIKELQGIPEPPQQLISITGDVAAEVACNVVRGVDLHNSTLSVFKIIQDFSWDMKGALAAVAHILTFGDSGFNVHANSKVSRQFLFEFFRKLPGIVNAVTHFGWLPTVYKTSKDPYVKEARTGLIVATYWIVRGIVDVSASHLKAMSTRRCRKFDPSASSPWCQRLEDIDVYLWNTAVDLHEELEWKTTSEALEKTKETLEGEDKKNMDTLNMLFPAKNDTDLLYDGLTKKRVDLRELEGICVLLLISPPLLEIDQALHILEMIYTQSSNQILPYELLWVPTDYYWRFYSTDVGKSMFEKTRSFMPWYSIHNPSLLIPRTIIFFEVQWKYDHDSQKPVMVALDAQGRVVHYNAIPMMLIWGNDAFPFTPTREQTLWDQHQTLSLNLLFDVANLRIHPIIFDWIEDDKYIFLYGGENIEWIRRFRLFARKVARKLRVPIEMVYVGKSKLKEPLQNWCDAIKQEEKGHCFIDPLMTWYFWRRLEFMKDSLIQHNRLNVVFQEIQRLHNFDKSNAVWCILAKGSRIIVNGHGEVALSTLEEYSFWKDKALEEGFGVGFQSHYQKLYRNKFPCERIELPTTTLNLPDTSNPMFCPNCNEQMQHCITYLCYHQE